MNFGSNLRINRCGWLTIAIIVFLLIYLRTDSSPANSNEMVSIKSLLKAGITAAERGGQAVVSARGDLKVESKGKTKEGANDPVTSADIASHCAMVSTLRGASARVRIMSEESGARQCDAGAVQGGAEPPPFGDDVEMLSDEFVYASDVTVWVDPLDATQEYTELLDKYVTTMVCVAVKGVPVVGVIHFPFSRTTSWAWLTKRTSSDLQRLSYNAKNHETPRVIVSRSHAGEVEKFARDKLGASVEHAGGAGYKVMAVAGGRADLYLHTTAIKKWDVCAGNAIISTLGGNMTTLAGKPIPYTVDAGVKNLDGLLVSLHDHDHYLSLIGKHN